MRANLLPIALVSALLLGSGCVRSYQDSDALAFGDLQYASTEGRPWKGDDIVLEEINARYGLPEATRVHYVELGDADAPTLIFIHGLGSYLKFWRHQLDAFAAQGYQVLALDMLGYGKSDKPATFPYTTEAMAEVVHAFAKARGAQRPTLIGHSMGGQTALSYAIRFPEALSALVLTSPAGFEHFTTREKTWFKQVFTTTLIKNSPEYALWGSIRRNNFAQWQEDFEWLVEERTRLVKSPQFDAYAYANVRSVHGLLENDFVRDNLDKVLAPTLIIYGDWDRLIPNRFLHAGHTREVMAYGRDHIPNARLVTLERCGHTVQMDCSARYNQEVAVFLQSR